MAKNDGRKPSVILTGIPYETARVLRPVKTTLDMITGAVNINNELRGLKKGASTDEVVEKINEIIRRLNASGGDHVQ